MELELERLHDQRAGQGGCGVGLTDQIDGLQSKLDALPDEEAKENRQVRSHNTKKASEIHQGDRLLRLVRTGESFGTWRDGKAGLPVHRIAFHEGRYTFTLADASKVELLPYRRVEVEPWPKDSILASDLTEYLIKPTVNKFCSKVCDLEPLRVLAIDRRSAEEQAESILYTEAIKAAGHNLSFAVRRGDMHEVISKRLYKPHPEKGYPTRTEVARRSIGAIYEDLVECLDAEKMYNEYWAVMAGIKYTETAPHFLKRYPHHALMPDSELPNFMHFICYAIEGGSEGHYVHVDLQLYDEPEGWPQVIPLYFGKYLGFEEAGDDLLLAYKVAARCAQLLNGWR